MIGTVCFGRVVLSWSTARLAAGLLVALWGFATPARAQQNGAPKDGASQASAAPAAEDAHELAKKLNNPIASLISVPLQSDVNCNIGPADDGCSYTLEIEPVIPISIADDWNVISRTILPITYQDDIFPGAGDQFGLADTLQIGPATREHRRRTAILGGKSGRYWSGGLRRPPHRHVPVSGIVLPSA